MRSPLGSIIELLAAISMISTGTYQLYTRWRDRRDEKRDARDEAEYQARKAQARPAQSAAPPNLTKQDARAGTDQTPGPDPR